MKLVWLVAPLRLFLGRPLASIHPGNASKQAFGLFRVINRHLVAKTRRFVHEL